MAIFVANFAKVYRLASVDPANPEGDQQIVTTPDFSAAQYTLADRQLDRFFQSEFSNDLVWVNDETEPLTFMGFFRITVDSAVHDLVVLTNSTFDYFVYGRVAGDAVAVNAQLPLAVPFSGVFSFPGLSNDDFDTGTICFAAGTLIATPEGERAVETLRIGDSILTSDGRTIPVRWIGLQTRHKAFTRERDFAPVRVKAGALGDGLPHSDLILTGDHAMIVDGLAINAAALVNGTTIAFEPMDSLPDSVIYYHIETENHEEILANGAPAETFVDYVGRRAFDNHQEYLDLYGCERIIPEMRRPRISARRQLPAATAARFGIAPFGADVEADAADLMARLAVA